MLRRKDEDTPTFKPTQPIKNPYRAVRDITADLLDWESMHLKQEEYSVGFEEKKKEERRVPEVQYSDATSDNDDTFRPEDFGVINNKQQGRDIRRVSKKNM